MPLRARAVAPALGLVAVAGAVQAGLVFSETETDESGNPAASVRVVRRVFADGESCKVLIEESGDPQLARGSFLLAAGGDAFIIDPARRTMTPAVPAEMRPVTQTTPSLPPPVVARIEAQIDEPGPPILGLPTRHYLYRVRMETQSGGATTSLSEERHEFWATSLPAGEPAPAAWQTLRTIEDAGRSVSPREARQAIEQMYQHGLVLRQIVEWHGPAVTDNERVVREVTTLSHEDIPPETFQRPPGLTQTENLAPRPEEN